MSSASNADVQMPPHHRKHEVAANRPAYREGRKRKAVKVYTVAQESRYLIVQRVAAIGLQSQLVTLFTQYGKVKRCERLVDYPSDEQFTEVYLLEYDTIWNARKAKTKLDEHIFYGSDLHVLYAPEYETVDDCRSKMFQRVSDVRQFLGKLSQRNLESATPRACDQVDAADQATSSSATVAQSDFGNRTKFQKSVRIWNEVRPWAEHVDTSHRFQRKSTASKRRATGRQWPAAADAAVNVEAERAEPRSQATQGVAKQPQTSNLATSTQQAAPRPALASTAGVKEEVRKRLKIIFRSEAAAKRAKLESAGETSHAT